MPFVKPVIVHGDAVHAVLVTVVPPPVATRRYAVIGTPPSKPGAVNPTVIACEDADAEVNVGAVGNAGATWNARVTDDAAAYCASPVCDATASHVPTAKIVTTPSADTVHAPFVVPAPNANDTGRPEDADALKPKLADPNATLPGWVKVMFWFSDPTAITCVTAVAERKFVYGPTAEAVTVHVPATVNVTTPAAIVQAPEAASDGVIPVAAPVTTETLDTVGVYVPFGNGDAGTAEVNASV